MAAGLVGRFLIGALIGVVAAVAVGIVVARPQIRSEAPEGFPVSLREDDGSDLLFRLESGNPKPLEPPPAKASIKLTSYHFDAPSPGPDEVPQGQWWRDSIPRITPITQFDGGPLQKVNCLMAAGAMLARLGFGVVTTGTQMRALQPDQDGGTNYGNVQDAIRTGWGVRFKQGALSPLQLRAVLYAGAGVIIDGVYGELPVDIRVQKSFTGRHAVYVDAFRPPGPDGPAAYYVMDPIGRTWRGYKGDWWPAEHVERFAAQEAGGRINTMWAFPGGKVPDDHRVLPPEAYPSAPVRPSQSPGGSLVPSVGPTASPDISTPEPTASPQPTVPPEPTFSFGPSRSFFPTDPFPFDDLDLIDVSPIGDPPPEEPRFPDVRILDDFAVIDPDKSFCLTARAGCPAGVVGVVDLLGASPAPSRPPRTLDILYASVIGPGTYQVIFRPPDGAGSQLWFWSDVAGSPLLAAEVSEATLDGQPVAIGTITLDPELDYSFVATASGNGIRDVSAVGKLDVAQ